MVNPEVDNYAKTLNHRKNIRNNLLKIKRILKDVISLKVAVQFSHLDCQAGISPVYLLSTKSLAMIYCFCI